MQPQEIANVISFNTEDKGYHQTRKMYTSLLSYLLFQQSRALFFFFSGVCFDLDNNAGTVDREVKSLLKISEVLECQHLLIITRDTERMLEIKGKKIEVNPVWKWLLDL